MDDQEPIEDAVEEESSEIFEEDGEYSKPSSSHIPDDFLLLAPPSWKHEALAALGLLLLLLLFRLQGLLHLSTHYLGGFRADAGLYSWLVQANLNPVSSEAWFNTYAFFPYSRTLAWSDNFLLPSLVVGLFQSMSISFIASYNLMILLAMFLNGYCTYRLAFRLVGTAYPAFAAGSSFMLLGYFAAQMGHPQLLFAFFFPLGLSALVSFVSQRSLLSAFFAGVTVFLCFLTTVYYALFLVVLYAVTWGLFTLLRPSAFSWRDHARFAIAALIGFLPTIPFILPYLDVRTLFGPRGIYESYYFSARGSSYFSTGMHSLFYGFTSQWSHDEARLFPGIVVLGFSLLAFLRICEAKALRRSATLFALSLSASLVSSEFVLNNEWYGYLTCVFVWCSLFLFGWHLLQMGRLEGKLGFQIITNRSLISIFLGIAIFFYAISLGPLGNPDKGHLALGISRLLYEIVPGANSIRAISRAGVVVLLALCLLVAFALPLVRAKLRWSKPLSYLLLILIFIENFVTTYPLEDPFPRPLVFSTLSNLPHTDQALLVLPFTSELKPNGTVKSWRDFAEKNVTYMHWTQDLGMYLVNGYSGQRSKVMKEFPRKLSGFPDQRSVNALGLIAGIRYIIYVPSFDANFQEDAFVARIRQFSSELSVLARDPNGNYLLEYLGKKWRVGDQYYLRTPSYPGGTLHLEVMGEYHPDKENYTLTLTERDHIVGEFGSLVIPADGRWDTYSFRLPAFEDPARPFYLEFETDSGSKIYLRRSAYALAEKVIAHGLEIAPLLNQEEEDPGNKPEDMIQ